MIYTITIFRKEIYEDIEDDTLFLQRIRTASQPVAESNELSVDEKNYPRLRRWVEKYYNKMLGIMTAYLYNEEVYTQGDDGKTNWEAKQFQIELPVNWPSTALQELVEACHDYLASGLEFEFMRLAFGPDDAQTQSRLASLNDAECDITRIINMRSGIQRARMSPFPR